MAIKLPRTAVWGQQSHGWSKSLRSSHETYKIGILRTKSPKGWKFQNVAVKLPRLAVWVHKNECGSNCHGWQFYGHFFKLPDMEGWPTFFGPKRFVGLQRCWVQKNVGLKKIWIPVLVRLVLYQNWNKFCQVKCPKDNSQLIHIWANQRSFKVWLSFQHVFFFKVFWGVSRLL